jgi:teichuronic acid biosynthesis glycosyltransferase TuaG
MHLISIIIPIYNREKILTETINSVITQTYTNWELLLVDDFSSDNSVAVIESYTQKYSNIKFYQSQKKGYGPAHPRNIGIKNAKGNYIAFLDSDDVWHRNKLEAQINILKGSQYKAICSNAEFFPSGHRNQFYRFKSRPISFEEYLDKPSGISTSCILIKKEYVDEIGFFEENIEFTSHEDYDYWLRMLSHNNNCIYFLNKNLVSHRRHNQNLSKTSTVDYKEFPENLIHIYRKYPNLTKEKLEHLITNKEYIGALNHYTIMYYDSLISVFKILKSKRVKYKDALSIFIKKRIIAFLSFLFPPKFKSKIY